MRRDIDEAMFYHRRAMDLIMSADTYDKVIANPLEETAYFYRLDGQFDSTGPFRTRRIRDRMLVLDAEATAAEEYEQMKNREKSE